MLQVNHRAALRLRFRAGFLIVWSRPGQKLLQRPRKLSRQDIRTRVPGNGLRRPVPEHDLTLDAKQHNPLRKTIQSGFYKFCAIGHPRFSISYIGAAQTNFIARAVEKKVVFC
jgi:hypothetical protein